MRFLVHNFGWVFPLFVAATLVWLNAEMPRADAGYPFQLFDERAFSELRGWPVPFLTRLNEYGRQRVESSLARRHTIIVPGEYDGDHPHLAWSPRHLVGNILCGCLLVGVSSVLAALINWLNRRATG